MKANEAPEKIYISNFDIKSLPKSEQLSERWHEVSTQNTDIEYTRTDAFIEKAEKFLEDKLTEKDCKFNWNDWTKVKSGYSPIASFMREFRMYMKGE